MDNIALIMPLCNEAQPAFDTIQTLVQSKVGALFNLVIIQERAEKNINLTDFDLTWHNQHTIGQLEIIDVHLGPAFNRARLLNHAIKNCRLPIIVPIYPGILLTRHFLINTLQICLCNPKLLETYLPFAVCLTSGRQNCIPKAWGQEKKDPGQTAGITPILLRRLFESIRGYDELHASTQPEAELMQRILEQFQLKPLNMAQFKTVNFVKSDILPPEQVNTLLSANDPSPPAPLMTGSGEAVVNPETWGEITAEYETGY